MPALENLLGVDRPMTAWTHASSAQHAAAGVLTCLWASILLVLAPVSGIVLQKQEDIDLKACTLAGLGPSCLPVSCSPHTLLDSQ